MFPMVIYKINIDCRIYMALYMYVRLCDTIMIIYMYYGLVAQVEELQTVYNSMVKDASEAVATDAGESEDAVKWVTVTCLGMSCPQWHVTPGPRMVWCVALCHNPLVYVTPPYILSIRSTSFAWFGIIHLGILWSVCTIVTYTVCFNHLLNHAMNVLIHYSACYNPDITLRTQTRTETSPEISDPLSKKHNTISMLSFID